MEKRKSRRDEHTYLKKREGTAGANLARKFLHPENQAGGEILRRRSSQMSTLG